MSIAWPRDTVALDTTGIPTATIHNFGDQTENYFPVTFLVVSGSDTLYRATDTVRTALAPGASRSMSFPAWTARPAGQHTAVCFTQLALDADRRNDTTRTCFRILDCRHDVGATLILAPVGTVDSGSVRTPRAIIRNFTGQPETFPVTMSIGTGYSQTQTRSLPGYGIDTIDFAPDWVAQALGTQPVVCYTALANDADRSNDTARAEVTVVRPPHHDVGALEILWPRGLVDSGTVAAPRAVIHNFGSRDEDFPVTLRIGIVYTQTINTSLVAGGTDTIAFPDWTAQPIGGHTTICYTQLGPDENRSNDTAYGSVCVSPPTRHDVGTIAILDPVGTLDSGTVRYPRAVIHNFGNRSDSFPVTFEIEGGYTATERRTLLAGQTDTVTFLPYWTARPLGTLWTRCYTALATDINPANDTAGGSVTVVVPEIHDVGAVTIVAPSGMLDSGTVTAPRALIRNFGTRDESFPVTFEIGTGYSQTLLLDLAAGADSTLTFPDWIAQPVGTHDVVCFTELASDANRANDTARAEAEVLALPRHDVGTMEIIAPVGLVDSGSAHTPTAVIHNYGNRTESFPVTFVISDGYSQTVQSSLVPGQTDTVIFPVWVAEVPGDYAAACYTDLVDDADRSNDTATAGIRVRALPPPDVGVVHILAPTGVAESGYVITPRAVVRHYPDTTDASVTFPVTMTIGTAYRESLTVTLPAGASRTVEFPDWTARPLGTHEVVCFTQFGPDPNRSNDTARTTVEVLTEEYHDVGAVAIIAPIGVYDSGTVETPRAVIRNFGTRSETFPVTFRIGAGYTETLLRQLTPGQVDTVSFPAWIAQPVGRHQTLCFTALDIDENRANDTVIGTDSVEVIRRRFHDVGATAIVSPKGVLDSGTVTTPRAVIRNFGNMPESFPVTLRIGGAYSEAQSASLAPGQIDTLTFPTWTAQPVGGYQTVCFTDLTIDENRSNDTAYGYDSVVVRPAAIHDVGTQAIVVPTGAVDSGTAHTPTAIIHNYGNRTESFPVTFTISNGYSETVDRTLEPGATDSVIFPAWVADLPGTYDVTCFTALISDTNRHNDTATAEVIVSPSDPPDVGAVYILAPVGQLEVGTTVTPLAVVRHYIETDDRASVTFPVTLTIGSGYRESTMVTLPAGGIDTISFADWTAQTIGPFDEVCYTQLVPDPNRSNDTARATVEVVAVPYHDVGVAEILAPTGTVQTGTAVAPRAVVVNEGNQTETFPVTLTIGADYQSVVQVEGLGLGEYDTLTFSTWTAPFTGVQAMLCYSSLLADENRSNDTVAGSVRVVNADAEAIEIVVPVGTVDSGLVVTPRAVIRNNGPEAAAFPVTLRIGADYTGTVLADLGPGASDTFNFPAWTAAELGVKDEICYTQLQGDPDPSNDTVRARVEVLPAGHDVATLAVLSPTGRAGLGGPPWRSAVTPRARITNLGQRSEALVPARFRIDRYEVRSGGSGNETTFVATVFEQTLDIPALEPGEGREVTFADTSLSLGLYVVTCSTRLAGDGDPSNDRKTEVFEVDDSLGNPEFDVRIYTRAGELIRRLGTTRQPGDPLWVTWDGRNDRGERVAPGTYICLMSVHDTDGPAIESRHNVLVRRDAAEIRLKWRQP